MTAVADVQILYIVDEELSRDSLLTDLEDFEDGFTVTTGQDASEAAALLDEGRFDCVLIAHENTETNSIELITHIRDTLEQNVPVMLYGGDSEVAVNALDHGATEHLPKGSTDAHYRILANRIEQTVEKYRVEAELDHANRQHNQYEVILETVPVGVFVIDDKGTIINCNERAAQMVGFDSETVTNQPFHKLIDEGVVGEDVINRYTNIVRSLLSSETDKDIGEFEYTVNLNGEERLYEASIALLPHDDEFNGTVGVFQDITKRRQQRQKLQRQNERLDEFASIVSHDLRNPITTLEGYLDLYHKTDDEEDYSNAKKSINRMESLVDDLLQLSKQGQTVDETESVQLEEAFVKAWAMVETHDATFDVDSGTALAADPFRLQQALENLIRNAVEHGREDIHIRAGGLVDGGFYIEDDGPGIPEDERDDVFEKGYTTSGDGTGFGLSIVREIAEAHGWKLVLTDGSDGGARFEFRVR